MDSKCAQIKILACASQGAGGDDEARLRALIREFDAHFCAVDKRQKWKSALHLLKQLRSKQFDLLLLEGSGIAAGLPAILARVLFRMPYVVSSGDAVGPFLSARHPLGTPLFSMYERALCCYSQGFIGWTPYLVGRALTYGAHRAITIPGWAPFTRDAAAMAASRRAIRRHYNIPEEAVLFGLVGSLNWSKRYQYCYGAELIRAAKRTPAYVLVVGDGSGLSYLKQLAGDALDSRIFLPGRIVRSEVPAYLAAMDVGSLPQSVDAVGSFRYTTKIAEYRAACLPVIVNQTPMAYDLDDGMVLRLPGKSPWDAVFVDALTELMATLTQGEVALRLRNSMSDHLFDQETQIERLTAFLSDLPLRVPAL